MDNYIIQYEGKSWEEEGWMTKRYLVAGNSFSRSVILRESEKDFPRPAGLWQSVLAYFGVMYYNV